MIKTLLYSLLIILYCYNITNAQVQYELGVGTGLYTPLATLAETHGETALGYSFRFAFVAHSNDKLKSTLDFDLAYVAFEPSAPNFKTTDFLGDQYTTAYSNFRFIPLTMGFRVHREIFPKVEAFGGLEVGYCYFKYAETEEPGFVELIVEDNNYTSNTLASYLYAGPKAGVSFLIFNNIGLSYEFKLGLNWPVREAFRRHQRFLSNGITLFFRM